MAEPPVVSHSKPTNTEEMIMTVEDNMDAQAHKATTLVQIGYETTAFSIRYETPIQRDKSTDDMLQQHTHLLCI